MTADLWDLERLATCSVCFELRCQRLARMNRAGRDEAAVECSDCDAGRESEADIGESARAPQQA